MTTTANKIIKYILLLGLAAIIAGLGYYLSGKQRLLTGNVLEGVTSPDVFNHIEFADPIGVTYPTGNVVSINSVLVDFKACGLVSGSANCTQVPGCTWTSPNCTGTSIDGYATGDDILGSLVYFVVSPAAACNGTTSATCPADQGCSWSGSACSAVADTGANVTGSQIDVSAVDYEVKVDIYVPDGADSGTAPDKLNTQSLIISQPDCSSLQTTLMKGQGTGIFSGTGTLPTAATSLPFDFSPTYSTTPAPATGTINFGTYYELTHFKITKLVISNPEATGDTLGSKQFELTFNFGATPLTYDIHSCNMNTDPDGACAIDVNNASPSASASNFNLAINAIGYSAFHSTCGDSPCSTPTATVVTTETGDHVNNYECSVTTEEIPAYCSPSTTPDACNAKNVCEYNTTTSTCVPKQYTQVIPNCFSGGSDGIQDHIGSISLSYPTTAVTGAQTFDITMNFVPVESPEDMPRAEFNSTPAEGVYEINVRDEGVDKVATASNFAYAFNNLIGSNSPFVPVIGAGSTVTLKTKELGVHTKDYKCMIDDVNYPTGTGKCFSGAIAGTGDAAGILTTPLVLDNKMNQGDTALVYAAGGLGDLEWKSTNPSILEVALFDEIDQGATGAGTAELMSQTLTSTYTVYPALGSYTIQDSDCTEVTDPDTGDILEQTCSFDVANLLVKYDAPADGTAIVLVDGDTYNIPVQFGKMSGYLSGTGIWTYEEGIVSMTLEGTVTGTVTGSAPSSIGAEGMVYGTVKSDVTLNTSITDLVHYASGAQIKATLISNLSSLAPLADPIEPESTLSSSIMKVETVITDTAVLYAKRPGTSILTVTDSQHCSASVSMEVIGQKVILEMQDRDPSEVFEVGDPGVQIKAYRGTAEGEILEDITTKPQLEWASSNQEVATVDGTGILTVHSPGMTNITAKYNSSEAEIGEINSNILTVRVNKITGMTIALNKATQALMPVEEKNQGYVNCALAINDPDAEGTSINIEGQNIAITYPTSGGPFESDVEKVGALAGKIKSQILAVLDSVDVTQSTANPGVLVLSANDNNTNGIVDISYSGNEQNVTILPFFPSNINLPATKTYSLMVLAEYQDGKTKLISPTSLTWINTPVNYLDTALLPAGMLKLGETAGESTVIARYVSVDVPPVNIDSNLIHVNVTSGPVIEYLNRIGVGAIQKGSELQFEMLISDIDTIADIDSLNVKLTSASNPALIFESIEHGPIYEPPADSGVVGEGEAEGEGEPASTAPYYRIYTFSVTIPDNSLLANGNYILSITATDTSANSSKVDKPIYIGAVVPGDVAGGGTVNFLDVYRAFQISTQMTAGTYTPTVDELEAADMDKDSDIDLMDVVAIFQLVTQSGT